mmetsp:Transcript_10725/g.20125  ORF Transcript_10725/g.20125 Transcript_10725/m.20125 type:complete len:1254 (+) Transcript_10725:366-4127(+)
MDQAVARVRSAVGELYHAAAGSDVQQKANSWLLAFEKEHDSLSVCIVLIRNGSTEDNEVVFFAAQVLLSRIRNYWGQYSYEEKENVFGICLGVIDQWEENENGNNMSALVISRLMLLLAAISVRSIQSRGDLLNRAMDRFARPPFLDVFNFLRLVVEELEICWVELAKVERRATSVVVVQVRQYTLNLFGQLINEIRKGTQEVDETVVAGAIKCIHSWVSCMIITEVASGDENQENENNIINLGVSFEHLLETAGGITLLEYICFCFSSADAESPIFSCASGILMDSLTFVSSGAFQPNDKNMFPRYKSGIELVCSTLIENFEKIEKWNSSMIADTAESEQLERSRYIIEGEDELETDPMILRWRSVCSICTALCTHHLKCVLLFCPPKCAYVLQILLYGISSPLDLSTVEACFDFWDVAGDTLFSTFQFLQDWNSYRHDSNALIAVPPTLTAGGSLELFSLVLAGFLSCSVVCIKSLSYVGKTGKTRLQSRIYDSFMVICSNWPELTAQQENHGLSDRSNENLIRQVLLLLHSKLTGNQTARDPFMARGVIELLMAVAEAAREHDFIDEEDDDEEEEIDDGTDLDDEAEKEMQSEHDVDSVKVEARPALSNMRKRTSSLAMFESDPVGLSSAPPDLWCTIISDLLHLNSTTTNCDVRAGVCRALEELTRWVYPTDFGRIESLLAGGAVMIQQQCAESPNTFPRLHIFCQVIGYLLSSLPVVSGDTCVASAKALLEIVKGMSSYCALVRIFPFLPFKVLRIRSDGVVLPNQMVECVGIDGIYEYVGSTEALQEAFRWSYITCAITYETLSMLALSTVVITRPELSRDVMAGRLCVYLKKLLAPVHDSMQLLVQGGNVESIESVEHVMVKNIVLITHTIQGLVIVKGSDRKKCARSVAPATALPLLKSILPLMEKICATLLFEHHSLTILSSLTKLYSKLMQTFHRLAAREFGSGMAVLMLKAFDSTHQAECIRLLADLVGLMGDSMVELVSGIVLKLTWLLVRPVQVSHVNSSDFYGTLNNVSISEEMLDPEVVRWFFSLYRTVCRDFPQVLVPALGPEWNAKGSLTVMELTLMGGAKCLTEYVGSHQGVTAVCRYLKQAVTLKSNRELVLVVDKCKGFLLDACIMFLASGSNSKHSVRKGLLIDILRVILSEESVDGSCPKKKLVAILSQPKYSYVPTRTREAVCYTLLFSKPGKTGLQAAISDTSLFLCGHMEPVKGFDYAQQVKGFLSGGIVPQADFVANENENQYVDIM